MSRILVFFLLFTPFSFIWSQNSLEIENTSYKTLQGITLHINSAEGVLKNYKKSNSKTLTVFDFKINNNTYAAGDNANLPEGNFTLNSDGSFEFVSSKDFMGDFPIIHYTVTNGKNTDTGILTITVLKNETPIAVNDYDTAEINTKLTVNAPGVLANDEDIDSDKITVTSFSVNGNSFLAGETITIYQGTIEIRGDGGYTFTPNPDYTGDVSPINYTVSDGNSSVEATLFLTTERISNLLSLQSVNSCNQGYGKDGNYYIKYALRFMNESSARDYHATNLIKDLNLTLDLDAIYGKGCVVRVDDFKINTNRVPNYVNPPYPQEFNAQSVNPDFLNGNSPQIFNTNNLNNAILYPRQSVSMDFCLVVNPFCGGRPNPTASGSGIDFDAVFNITSSIGNDTKSLLLTDFHSTETQVIGNFNIPEPNPKVNPDGTYDYVNTVSISNESNTAARNINFNMGLGSFLDNGLQFKTLQVKQISGPPITVNSNYNGNNHTLLLAANNSLAAKETIVLEIFHVVAPVSNSAQIIFSQMENSQSKGAADGFDEQTAAALRDYSFTIWEDNTGAHVDRYYNNATPGNSNMEVQCLCDINSMQFAATSSNQVVKTIHHRETMPNGILEHEELTYHITLKNTSEIVNLDNIQLREDLGNICVSNIMKVGQPEIIRSTALNNPTLNNNFDGINDTNIFQDKSGLLQSKEELTISITVLYNEDCLGNNTVQFTATDPFNRIKSTTSSVAVNIYTDTDKDGISNLNDLDDDNDGIPDVLESGGLNPLEDSDNDLIPNYRDADFGADRNQDGIVDRFDFDMDGVPNHFDLDADNDGIFDITEGGNKKSDSNNDGKTNRTVGTNGLDDTLEIDDSFHTVINYTVPNTDADTLPNYLDIDSDGDGVVDNIEAQPTESYTLPAITVNTNGIINNYLNGLNPVDSEGDGIYDYIDVNSDGDIRDDIIEAWDTNSDGIPETSAGSIDIDKDGLDDNFDKDLIHFNASNNQTPLDFPNADYAITNERDWRELMAIVILLSDASQTEGEKLMFNIELVTYNDESVPVKSASDIHLNLNTENGVINETSYNFAVAPYDFEALTNFNLVIPALTSTSSFTVTSFDDNIYENEEHFKVSVAAISNNTLSKEVKATGTIVDNEQPPSFTFEDATAKEGEELNYTISLSRPSSEPTNFLINTSNKTAIAPNDYNTITAEFTVQGTIDPNHANLETVFSVITKLDNLNELEEETLQVKAMNTTNNTANGNLTRNGTIIDIDPFPLVVINDDKVTEGKALSYTISLVNEEGELMQNYLPINLTIQTADESTSAAFDYQPTQLEVVIPAMKSEIYQKIKTINDDINEDTETMNVIVLLDENQVSNNTSEIVGLGVICDDDVPNLFSPNGNGLSEKFQIAGLEEFKNFELQIMDRWGNVIYDYKNNGKSQPLWWDGTSAGKAVKEGVYYYFLNYNDPSMDQKNGFVQLVR